MYDSADKRRKTNRPVGASLFEERHKMAHGQGAIRVAIVESNRIAGEIIDQALRTQPSSFDIHVIDGDSSDSFRMLAEKAVAT